MTYATAAVATAFTALKRAGFFTQRNFRCCQSCALAEIPGGAVQYVFYHAQDTVDLKETGECFLAWGGDGAKIVEILHANGLKTEWDGSPDHRIKMIASVPA